MYIITYIKELVNKKRSLSTQSYLILANIALVFFGIWFSNAGLLPFAKYSDFAIFLSLSLLFALYRPGWMFVFFMSSIALESINLLPEKIGVALRPYQFAGLLTMLSFAILYAKKRIRFFLPKWLWVDASVMLFSLSGFISAAYAGHNMISFKQSAIAVSFAALYFLTRIYVQNYIDLKKTIPFFLGSSFVLVAYSIWQNWRFSKNLPSFEVMPGRPNATFAEPDWLGSYSIILLAVVYAIMIFLIKKSSVGNQTKSNSKKELSMIWLRKNYLLVSCYAFLVWIFVALVLTVSRSAWLGALVLTLAFLKMISFEGMRNFRSWKWKSAGQAAMGVLLAFVLALGFISTFQLTNFDLFNRAQSTSSGLQEITISCDSANESLVPKRINDLSELSKYGCIHINLEEIEIEKSKGMAVLKVFRPDPNISVRSEIYRKSWNEIRKSPVFGIGWGNIGNVLGNDDNGNSLNSSNLFLEVWLGSGILGLLAFVSVWIYILYRALSIYVLKAEMRIEMGFVMLGSIAIIVPNLFNAGIFLGFLWVYLAVSVSLVSIKHNLK